MNCNSDSHMDENDSQTSKVGNLIIPPEAIRRVFTELDSETTVDDDTLEAISCITQNFIEGTIQRAYHLARHRQSDTLELRDLWAHLKNDWNLTPSSLPHIPSDGVFQHLSPSSDPPDHHLEELVNQKATRIHAYIRNIFNEQTKENTDELRLISRHRVRSTAGIYQTHTNNQIAAKQSINETNQTDQEINDNSTELNRKGEVVGGA